MATDFLKMLKEQQQASQQETVKEVEQPQKVKKESQSKDLTPKADESNKQQRKQSSKAKKEDMTESYEYPFSLYTEGRVVDISEYGFEDGKKYTPKQINDIMLKHRHYEFAGEMVYKMFEDDNTLVVTAKQYKKG